MPRFYVRQGEGASRKGARGEAIVLDRAFCHREVFASAKLEKAEAEAERLNRKHAR